ncbi:MAG: L,D-transpeptidase family protein [Usitatibacter sp.]
MIGRLTLRQGARVAQRLALVAFATGATALADGSGSFGGPAFSNEAEGALVRAIVGLRDHGLKQAMLEVDKMLARNPNHRLAYMIKGDLLMASAGQPVAFASSAAASAASNANVASLQDEARVRVKRYLDAPPVDYLPAPLMQLAPDQSHALLVDTSRSRLFVYANDLGRPRYVTDFYISLGKNGVDKAREGDQKTPIGVYNLLPMKDRLPDFYGPGAYPLSYPNEWDRANGRNGHGIWVHGTPSDTYSRAPWATDGCVVLTNEDLARLSKYVDVNHTPVVIGQSVAWHSPDQWENERASILAAFNKWKVDWESLDTNRYLSHYSRSFRSENSNYNAWSARKRQVNAGKTWVKIGVNDVSIFEYPGSQDLMMISFEQDYRSNNMSKRTFKRQFWAREDGQWRIVHEAVVNS